MSLISFSNYCCQSRSQLFGNNDINVLSLNDIKQHLFIMSEIGTTVRLFVHTTCLM